MLRVVRRERREHPVQPAANVAGARLGGGATGLNVAVPAIVPGRVSGATPDSAMSTVPIAPPCDPDRERVHVVDAVDAVDLRGTSR